MTLTRPATPGPFSGQERQRALLRHVADGPTNRWSTFSSCSTFLSGSQFPAAKRNALAPISSRRSRCALRPKRFTASQLPVARRLAEEQSSSTRSPR
jgi:hypothetical protein